MPSENAQFTTPRRDNNAEDDIMDSEPIHIPQDDEDIYNNNNGNTAAARQQTRDSTTTEENTQLPPEGQVTIPIPQQPHSPRTTRNNTSNETANPSIWSRIRNGMPSFSSQTRTTNPHASLLSNSSLMDRILFHIGSYVEFLWSLRIDFCGVFKLRFLILALFMMVPSFIFGWENVVLSAVIVGILFLLALWQRSRNGGNDSASSAAGGGGMFGGLFGQQRQQQQQQQQQASSAAVPRNASNVARLSSSSASTATTPSTSGRFQSAPRRLGSSGSSSAGSNIRTFSDFNTGS